MVVPLHRDTRLDHQIFQNRALNVRVDNTRCIRRCDPEDDARSVERSAGGIRKDVDFTVGVFTETEQRQTERLLVKHDNQYRAPSEDEDYDMDQMIKSMQLEAQGDDA